MLSHKEFKSYVVEKIDSGKLNREGSKEEEVRGGEVGLGDAGVGEE